MSKGETVILKYRIIILLSVIFFVLRLTRLDAIPIFNDEAIYLDWGWRELHRPNNLFYSLYDAKPPLLMWLFGLMSVLLPSLLTAGRCIGVVFGYITLLGVWVLAKEVSSRKTAIVASLLYIAIPLFSFFDRQALMESAIGAVGIWSCFATLKAIDTHKYKWSALLGFILGIGIFIKPNAAIFIIPALFILGLHYLKRRNTIRLITHGFILLSLALVVLSPMLIQSIFWETIHLNSRYVAPISFSQMIPRLVQTMEIMIVHLTPIAVITLIVSLISLLSLQTKKLVYVGIWFLTSLLVNVFLIHNITERYIVSVLPIATILMANALNQIKHHIYQYVSVSMTVGIAFIFTLIQIISPLIYFSLLSGFSQFSFVEYRHNFSSGYGIPEAVDFLTQKIGDKPAFIATAVHTGNPESGIMVSFMKQRNVYVSYLEAQYITDIDTYDCLASPVPIYFVSREDDTVGLDRFFTRVYYQKSAISGFGIGIYTLKQPCMGKTLELKGFRT